MATATKKRTTKKQSAPPHDYQVFRDDTGWLYVIRDADGNELARSDSFPNRGFAHGQARADYPGIRRS